MVELNARERAQALLDEGSYRELLGPFERLESPWLLQQGVVPQADDGLIVARGKISGTDSVILAIEGQFQGGGIGEVGCWGAMEQKSSIRIISSDFPEEIGCVPQRS